MTILLPLSLSLYFRAARSTHLDGEIQHVIAWMIYLISQELFHRYWINYASKWTPGGSSLQSNLIVSNQQLQFQFKLFSVKVFRAEPHHNDSTVWFSSNFLQREDVIWHVKLTFNLAWQMAFILWCDLFQEVLSWKREYTWVYEYIHSPVPQCTETENKSSLTYSYMIGGW